MTKPTDLQELRDLASQDPVDGFRGVGGAPDASVLAANMLHGDLDSNTCKQIASALATPTSKNRRPRRGEEDWDSDSDESLSSLAHSVNMDEFDIHTTRALVLSDSGDPLETTYLSAIADNADLAKVERCLEQGVNIMARGNRGATALHVAAWNNAVDIARLLLNRGIQVDVKSSPPEAHTPLHNAVALGHIDAAELLIEYGASPITEDGSGYRAIHHAAQCGRWQAAHFLITRCGVHVDEGDGNDHTAMMWAAYKCDVDSLRYFLMVGGDIHLTDREGRTALHWSAISGSIPCAQVLLEHGAVVSTVDDVGDTPAKLAKEQGHRKLAKLLSKRSPAGRQQPQLRRRRWMLLIAGCAWVPALLTAVRVLPPVADFAAIFVSFAVVPRMVSYLFGAANNFLFGQAVSTIACAMLSHLVFLSKEWGRHWFVLGISVLCLFANAVMMVAVKASDPGIIPHARDSDMNRIGSLRSEDLKKFCLTCRVVKPLRTKHCPYCNVCVLGFDHHCQWLNIDVGFRNHRVFMTFLISCILASLTFSVMCYVVIAGRIGKVRLVGSAWDAWVELKRSHGTLVSIGVYLSFLSLLTIFLFVEQTCLIARNLKKNEAVNWPRYEYLHTDDGKFRNTFDRGILQNFIDFCCVPKHEEVALMHSYDSEDISMEPL